MQALLQAHQLTQTLLIEWRNLELSRGDVGQ
jgi:hypothetical protein